MSSAISIHLIDWTNLDSNPVATWRLRYFQTHVYLFNLDYVRNKALSFPQYLYHAELEIYEIIFKQKIFYFLIKITVIAIWKSF